MLNNPILVQARLIANNDTEKDLERAEAMLIEYLKVNPEDTDAWLMLIMIEWTPPLEDSERIIQWANNILAYDPVNARGLLVLAEAYVAFRGGINATIYKQLSNACSNDSNLMAMIEVAKAKYLERQEGAEKEYEDVLIKSINYGPLQERNHSMLGEFYLKQGKVDEGKKLIKKAEENSERARILHKYSYDVTSLTNFLNEFYTGLQSAELVCILPKEHRA